MNSFCDFIIIKIFIEARAKKYKLLLCVFISSKFCLRVTREFSLSAWCSEKENIILITRAIKTQRILKPPLSNEQQYKRQDRRKSIKTKISLEIRLRTFTAIASPLRKGKTQKKHIKREWVQSQITSRVIYIRQCGANW
jgi:hypothetical protein